MGGKEVDLLRDRGGRGVFLGVECETTCERRGKNRGTKERGNLAKNW